jgi:hypothetical protein
MDTTRSDTRRDTRDAGPLPKVAGILAGLIDRNDKLLSARRAQLQRLEAGPPQTEQRGAEAVFPIHPSVMGQLDRLTRQITDLEDLHNISEALI